VQLTAYGLLTLNEKTPHPERMWRLYEEVEMLITLYGVDRVSVESLKSLRNAKVGRILEDYIAVVKMAAWRVLGQEIVLLTQERIRARIGVQAILPVEKKSMSSKQRSLLMKERTLVRINNAFNAGINEFDTSDGIAVAWAGLGGP
jgi:Holliday junction resolvasome RuvABC endonuclease subunit